MHDGMGRQIDYLRISITDRCNLRCRYCMPGAIPHVPHEQILRYEEILRLCAIAGDLGVRRFRVTGGEPLIRRGAVEFLAALKQQPSADFVGLTTNGVLLGEQLPALARAGVDAINVSLDTLRPERYARLTGQDSLSAVLEALLMALEMGIQIKLNCVTLEGINDDEVTDLAALAAKWPLDVRFIEVMPMGAASGFRRVTGAKVLERLKAVYPDLAPVPLEGDTQCGPARYYESRRLRGRLGFINPMSQHFCKTCNRVRLSSEGFLRLCLYHQEGIDLRAMLRGGAADAQIKAAMEGAIAGKPQAHLFGGAENGELPGLSTIGG